MLAKKHILKRFCYSENASAILLMIPAMGRSLDEKGKVVQDYESVTAPVAIFEQNSASCSTISRISSSI
jgi:hypothetical protein